MSCKVFIASSTRAKPLAKWLGQALVVQGFEARPWFDVAQSGQYILQNLTDEAFSCDFAAVLLTPDDLRAKVAEDHMVPRDNCIFEAGLFTGALKDPKRCFLFVSVDNKALPTDLQGLVYLKMGDTDWLDAIPEQSLNTLDTYANHCRVAFGDTFQKMTEAMRKTGPCRRSNLATLTTVDLIQAEQLTPSGGLNWNSSVLVSSDKPIERGQTFAARVFRNMEDTVNYTYFFSVSTNVRTMAEVIQALAAGSLQAENPIKRQQLMADKPEPIRKNINEVLKKRLKIYFVKDPPLFKFCVHNVKDKEAACYLRYSDGESPSFIKWRTGESVDDVVDEILKPIGPKDGQKQIFRSTRSFNLYAPENEDMCTDLREAVMELFPSDLVRDIEAACFLASKSAAQ